MRKFLVLFISIILISCSKSTNKSPSSYYIEFNGFKGEFYKKYPLRKNVVLVDEIKHLDSLIKLNKRKFICSRRPVMWEADIYSNPDNKYIITIISNTDNEINVIRKNRCFENEDLIDLVCSLVSIDIIKDYKGPLSQKEYENLLNQKD